MLSVQGVTQPYSTPITLPLTTTTRLQPSHPHRPPLRCSSSVFNRQATSGLSDFAALRIDSIMGGASVPGPAVSLLCVPAAVSEELHARFVQMVGQVSY